MIAPPVNLCISKILHFIACYGINCLNTKEITTNSKMFENLQHFYLLHEWGKQYLLKTNSVVLHDPLDYKKKLFCLFYSKDFVVLMHLYFCRSNCLLIGIYKFKMRHKSFWILEMQHNVIICSNNKIKKITRNDSSNVEL